MCECNIGYTGNGTFCTSKIIHMALKTFVNSFCAINSIILCSILDVDECNSTIFPCGDNANCTDTDGSFKCDCLIGFQGNGFNCTGMYFIRCHMTLYIK